ncbi:MAG: hypothetical protein WKF79_03945 [Nocardioides sp.]
MSRLPLLMCSLVLLVACDVPVLAADDSVGELVLFHGPDTSGSVLRGQIELGPDQSIAPLGVATDADGADLPTLDDGVRRFAFVLTGCQENDPELLLEADVLQAEFTEESNVDCGQLEYYVAVFDVPEDDLPEGFELDDDILGEPVHVSAHGYLPDPPVERLELAVGESLAGFGAALQSGQDQALPELAAEARRFGFAMQGCREDPPYLGVVDGVLTPGFPVQQDRALCEVPETYVVVFDVPRVELPREFTLTPG